MPKFEGCPWLIPNPETRQPFVSFKHSWETARDVAGLKGLHVHDLRHTAASLMAAASIDLYTIGKVLGHQNIASSQRYSHLANDKRLAAVEAGAAKMKGAFYEQEIYRDDPAIRFASANPSARLFDTHRVIPANDYLADPYIRWSGDRLGSTHWQVAYTAPEDDLTFGIALHRTKDRGPLGVEGTRHFTMLFSHMERAKRLSARAPDFSGSADSVIAVDRRGQVIAVSGAAERCLTMNDGIMQFEGALRCRSQAKLDGLIRSALEARSEGGAGGAFVAERPSGKRPWVITVTPIGRAEGPFAFFQAVALLRIIDPEAGPAPDAAARWMSLYGFTSAESRLAEAMLRGEGNIRLTADCLGIADATARVQLTLTIDVSWDIHCGEHFL